MDLTELRNNTANDERTGLSPQLAARERLMEEIADRRLREMIDNNADAEQARYDAEEELEERETRRKYGLDDDEDSDDPWTYCSSEAEIQVEFQHQFPEVTSSPTALQMAVDLTQGEIISGGDRLDGHLYGEVGKRLTERLKAQEEAEQAGRSLMVDPQHRGDLVEQIAVRVARERSLDHGDSVFFEEPRNHAQTMLEFNKRYPDLVRHDHYLNEAAAEINQEFRREQIRTGNLRGTVPWERILEIGDKYQNRMTINEMNLIRNVRQGKPAPEYL